MNRNNGRRSAILLVGVSFCQIACWIASMASGGDAAGSTAHQQANSTIGRCVMASGGTLGAISQHYTHNGTLGQTIVGGAQSTNNFLIAGFWQLPSLATGVGSGQRADVPTTYVLYQNYPNPFNPSTTLRYGLPQKSSVNLVIFNTFGQQVAELVKGEMEAGYHELQFRGEGLASGVYFYRLSAGSFVETKKLLLLK